MKELISCFHFIDMAIKRVNEAPSEEMGEGLRTKSFFKLDVANKTYQLKRYSIGQLQS